MANLRIPGPTPCRNEVRAACSKPMINYRGPQMALFMEGLLAKLKTFLSTERNPLLLTTSGTGGLEAAITNTLSPRDRVVGIDAGVFGKRFCSVAKSYGASVRVIDVQWGHCIEPEVLRGVLRQESNCRAVLLTHNETSTGILHPLKELSEVVREETDALILVDSVSGLGATPLLTDELHIDVVITASQKAWGAPPGLALLCLSERAWQANKSAEMPRFYFDLLRYKDSQERGSFPFTPALPILFALDVTLDFMIRETPEAIFSRHDQTARHVRQQVMSSGFSLFADERHASPTVTSIRIPDSVNEEDLVRILRDEHKTILARGQEKLQGSIIRLGHLGWFNKREIDNALGALLGTLSRMSPSSN